MITILLDNGSFEQDIRELLMAYFPGETFSHREEDASEAEKDRIGFDRAG